MITFVHPQISEYNYHIKVPYLQASTDMPGVKQRAMMRKAIECYREPALQLESKRDLPDHASRRLGNFVVFLLSCATTCEEIRAMCDGIA